MTSLADVQRAFTRVCFEPEPRDEDLALLHDDRERWLMYRRMVRSRFFDMARAGLPRSAELLGKARFDAVVSAYLAEHRPQTRFIRDVVHELVAHALPGWEADDALPPHTAELVRYEELKWRVSNLEWEDRPHVELDFEAAAVMNPTVRWLPLSFRVDKTELEAPPKLDERHLALVYRRPGGAKIHTYVLNDVGARLFLAWTTAPSCADGVRQVLADMDRQPDARFIDGMAGVLADLVEHRIVLGSPI